MSASLSETQLTKEKSRCSLPVLICQNPREIILPENVTLPVLNVRKEKDPILDIRHELPDPIPRYPLNLDWQPERLLFKIDEEPIKKKLRVWNTCSRPIYFHCCGLWNDTAGLGASWTCHPRTRFRLSPGLSGEILVKAYPRSHSPVDRAVAGLQIAAENMRDVVLGHFVVFLDIEYLNYVPPAPGEGA